MKSTRQVLIVEDEPVIRNTLREFLTSEGFLVSEAATVADALTQVRQRDFVVAICDVRLPDGDGIGLLKRLLQMDPDLFVLIITAYATVENAVEAFKAGAYDYLVKPVLFDDLHHKLQRLFRYRELFVENQSLRRELSRQDRFDELVGSSKSLEEVQATIRKIAATHSNVLLEGESGTGKELFARVIHRAGPKSHEKLLAVHCATQPVELLEAQLFGQCKGAFPGAQSDQPGILLHAGEGTVFLDEVGQLPLATQSKLLRAMEFQEIMPLGGTEPVRVASRIIASTTRDLMREVAEGRFQEDLFYRLNGVKIRIPPLRERLDDIPELVEFFIGKHTAALGKRVTGATSETMRLLMSARWKGNVRQLDNAIERAVIMCEEAQIEPKDLPPDLLGVGQILPDTDDLRSALRHYERMHISRVLRQWPDKREAAKRLRLGLSSLYRKIEELGLDL
ncbi:MAG: sigma-54-dependent Fis family transcriptional regulator [Planctomycetaceae bacterium]|nr:sigma-54-dependent Fis family transcriptional regulator [Planctomycetaceae bacterium]